jgi:hypothetical protein
MTDTSAPRLKPSPYTRWLRHPVQRRRVRRLRANAKQRLKSFQNLRALDTETKRRLAASVRHYEIRMAAMEMWQSAITMSVGLFMVLLSYLAIFVPPYAAVRYMPSVNKNFTLWQSEFGVAYVIALGMIALVIFLMPITFLALLPKRFREYMAFESVTFTWLGTLLLICAIVLWRLLLLLRERSLGTFSQAAAVIMMGMFSYLLMMVIVIPLGNLLRSNLKRRMARLAPDAVIVDGFLKVLSLTESKGKRLLRVDTKRELVATLEEVASCVERYLPGRLETRDFITDGELRKTSEQMAAGVRDLMAQLFNAKSDTSIEFKSRVTDYFKRAARGHWGSFPLVEPKRLSRPEILQSQLKALARGIVSAAVPIVLLLLVKRLGVVPEGQLLTYLTVGSYIWAALTLLSHVDQNYSAKLGALKDVTALLPSPKKDKD